MTLSDWMYPMLRSLLFRCDPERTHTLALSILNHLPSFLFKQPKGKAVKALGMTFPHSVGLAAGLDKNGDYLDALAKLGFSFIELGTVTPRPQLGNPKPRLFRLLKAEALINRMGFNNKGVDALVQQVKKSSYTGILGINIGKNKDTALHQAAQDYCYCLRRVYALASYVTINLSSPNTPGLRELQGEAYLVELLKQLQQEQNNLTQQFQRHVPLVVKISPDESDETLKRMVDILLRFPIEGLIATNTTIARDSVQGLPHAKEQGGLSGSPLLEPSTRCLRLLKSYVGDHMALIGVGGIDNAQAAQMKREAGASLIQIYSGLIYKGPSLISALADQLP